MHGQRWHRVGSVARLALVVLAGLAVVVTAAEALADSSFTYGDVTWHTYQRHGVWYMASASDTFQVRAGRVTAVFDAALTSAEIQSVIQEVPGVTVLRHTRFNTYDFEFSPDDDPGWYASAFSSQSGVIEAVPDALCMVVDATPNDEYFGFQWALHNTGQSNGTRDADIDALAAWDSETGDTTVVIAVIDAGFGLEHTDLDKSLWTNWTEATGADTVDDDGNGFVDDIHGYDFYNDDGDPGAQSWETGSHGTHVAGIAAAKTSNAELGVAGIAGGWGQSRATGCKLMVLRFGVDMPGPPVGPPDTLSFAAVDDAIDYAASNGADVINMSFHSLLPIAGLSQAVNYAWGEGVVMVAASGNSATKIHEPASNDKVMAIGATANNDTMAYYSTSGSQLNLAAPGGETGPIGDPDEPKIYSTVRPDNYGYLSGTSMASSMVAGAAALARSADSDLTNSQIWSVLEFSVDDTAGMAAVGWEDDYGWGRLNIATMLDAIDYRANSRYTYTDSLCKVFCPGADADTFVITVTIRDGQDNPVEGIAATAIWVESYAPVQFKVCCAAEDHPRCHMTYTPRVFADGPTDSLGVTTISFKAGGGSYFNPMRKVREYGLGLAASGVPWELAPFRSFDITKDCVVDDSDLAAFSTMRGKQNTAADFDCDGDVDSADSLLLASHYGHACPGSRGGRDRHQGQPGQPVLSQNSPNPFNPTTGITYQIPSDRTRVRIAVYDIAGRLVRTLVDGLESAGGHEVAWDGKDSAGRELASGVYFYLIETPGYSEQRKMVLLK